VAVEAEEYRNALKRFPTAVTIVTTALGGTMRGLTATAFAAVSLQPPLVLVCLEKGSRTRALVMDGGRFVVNMLNESQVELAHRFATKGEKSFDDVPHTITAEGIPKLEGAISILVCNTVSVVGGGDHDVFIAAVESVVTAPGRPLLHYDRAYRMLAAD
jgi:flavin reductase ActVB